MTAGFTRHGAAPYRCPRPRVAPAGARFGLSSIPPRARQSGADSAGGRADSWSVADLELPPSCDSAPSPRSSARIAEARGAQNSLPITPRSTIRNLTPRTMRPAPLAATEGASTSRRAARPIPSVAPNGWRVSGERRAEGDERVRCTRMLGAMPPFSPTMTPSPSSPNRMTAPPRRSRGRSRATAAKRKAFRSKGGTCPTRHRGMPNLPTS